MKEFYKSIKNWQSYSHDWGGSLFYSRCTSVTKIGWNSFHWFWDMVFTRFSRGTDSRTHGQSDPMQYPSGTVFQLRRRHKSVHLLTSLYKAGQNQTNTTILHVRCTCSRPRSGQITVEINDFISVPKTLRAILSHPNETSWVRTVTMLRAQQHRLE